MVKNILSFLLKAGISVGLLAYLFSKIDLGQMIGLIRNADPAVLGLAFLVFFSINFLLLLRWIIYIRALDLRSPFFHIVVYYFAALFFNLFLPSSTGGDLYKIWGLCRDTPHKAKVVASVVLDRLTGFFAIAFIALILYVLGYRLIRDPGLLVSIVLLACVPLGITLFLFNQRLYSFACQIFNRLPKIKNGLMNIHYDIALLKDQIGALWKALGVSTLTQVLLAVVFYIVAMSFHQGISLIYFLIFVPIICVASSFPSIGGLGVREAGAVYLFAKIGVDSSTALSLSLMIYFFMVLAGLIGGAVYVVALFTGRIQHYQADPGARREGI